MRVRGFLIVKADGSMRTRTVTRTPRLMMDEFAFKLDVTIPDAWGRVLGDIAVEIPDTVVPDIAVTMAEEVNNERQERKEEAEV